MANVGRPPKPTERKRATGNPGKRALPKESEVVVIPAALDIPEPSRPLGRHGKAWWDTVWQIGINWISPSTDLEIMLMTAELIDERWNLRIQVMTKGEARDRRALRDLERLIGSNLSQLGLTPADRARLGLAEVKRMSKIAELKAMTK